MRKGCRLFREFIVGRDDGSMTIEFVLMVPVLLFALVFSFEFGKALWAYDVMTRDLRGAVRYLSRAQTYDATTRGQAENMATRGESGTVTPVHFPWTGSPTFTYLTTAFATPNYGSSGQVITMTADVPITLSFLAFLNRMLGLTGGSAINVTYTLRVSYQARYIGN